MFCDMTYPFRIFWVYPYGTNHCHAGLCSQVDDPCNCPSIHSRPDGTKGRPKPRKGLNDWLMVRLVDMVCADYIDPVERGLGKYQVFLAQDSIRWYHFEALVDDPTPYHSTLGHSTIWYQTWSWQSLWLRWWLILTKEGELEDCCGSYGYLWP
jgi:hypothetical protein